MTLAKNIILNRILGILSIVCLGCTSAYAQTVIVGKVYSKEDQSPLVGATVQLDNGMAVATDKNGSFKFNTKATLSSFTLHISYIGYKSVEQKITSYFSNNEIKIALALNNLFLKELEVTAKKVVEDKGSSTYSISKEVIEQSQAVTLSEVLQFLPGQEISDIDMTSVSVLNLRTTEQASAGRNNNAFGVGIVLNGSNVSNNANMQTATPTRFNSFRGATDTPGGGLDLRQIPIGNIEKVEVVQGVASAKYGDITEGAVIIETAAGKTPWMVNVQSRAGNQSFSVTKGYHINDRHSVTANFDYMYTNKDPRDLTEQYDRTGGSLLWTSYLGELKNVKNTLSVSYNIRKNRYDLDPSLGGYQRYHTKNWNLRMSNRLSWYVGLAAIDKINLNASYAVGSDYTYYWQRTGNGSYPATNVLETGLSDGVFIPPSYESEAYIDGKPVNTQLSISFSKRIRNGNWSHQIEGGSSYSFDQNLGEGRVFNPFRPISFLKGERPFSFKDERPFIPQYGAYITDAIKTEFLGKTFTANIGFRGDYQYKTPSFSPRINIASKLNKNFRVHASYGIQVKAPGLVHLFPGPTYTDYTALNYFTGNAATTINLLYTDVNYSIADNLKPMRSERLDIGFSWNIQDFNLSLSAFQNITPNGFTTVGRPTVTEVPVFEILSAPENERPVYEATGEVRSYPRLQSYITNDQYRKNIGLELYLTTPKIEFLQSAFTLSLSAYRSNYKSKAESVSRRSEDAYRYDEVWFSIKEPQELQNVEIKSLVSSSHHIPELGLLVNLYANVYLTTYTKYDLSNQRAIAYIDPQMQRHDIPEDQRFNAEFDFLASSTTQKEIRRTPSFVYTNIHLRLSKNITPKVKLSFMVNNVFNLRPKSIDVSSSGVTWSYLNSAPQFGMTMSMKF